MTVNISKPAVNLREELANLKKPSGIVGESILRADTAADAVEQLNLEEHTFENFTSTGIDDNATSTAMTLDSNGLTVDGNGVFQSTAPSIVLKDTDNVTQSSIVQSGSHIYVINQATGAIRLRTDSNKDRLYVGSNGDISFYEDTGTTPKLFWDASAESLGIGTSAPSTNLHIKSSAFGDIYPVQLEDGGGTVGLKLGQYGSVGEISGTTGLDFEIAESLKMRIDSSGNLLVGRTSASDLGGIAGAAIGASGYGYFTRNSAIPLHASRLNSDGTIIELLKDGTTVGGIGIASSGTYFDGEASHAGIRFGSTQLQPRLNGAASDGGVDLGSSFQRWQDVYATNGTIQTSDANEKQQIASLTTAEMQAANAISKLFKTFKWNDAVAEKGDAEARRHTGVIAQEVEQALVDAGLNAGDYAFFISGTWWEADETYTDDEGVEQTRVNTYETQAEAPQGAVERTRKGIRYPELLAFVGAATEQRLASIEARLTALETA